jgi:hypothetical protein
LGFELKLPDRFVSGLYASPCCVQAFYFLGACCLKEIGMSDESVEVEAIATRPGLTLDWWAVLLALVLALLVRVGVLQHIPW